VARLGTGSADPRGYDEDLVRAPRALRRAVEGRWFHTGAGGTGSPGIPTG